jgi:hypothetical protein
MSLVQFAQAKNAIEFKKALEEKIADKVSASLQESKIELASTLFGGHLDEETLDEATKTFHSAAEFKAHAAKKGHTIETEYEEGPTRASISSTGKRGLASGKTGRAIHYAKDSNGSIMGVYHTVHGHGEYHSKPMYEETLDKATTRYGLSGTPSSPSSPEASGGVKPTVKKLWKKPAVGTHGASAPEPRVPGGHLPEGIVSEKVITPGTVDHMAHAVHDIATAQTEPNSIRGTFSQYHTPHYIISKDHGSINPDELEHNYFVAGPGGMHKFSVHHSSKGVDVKHHGQVG